jgi:hypothetical protein
MSILLEDSNKDIREFSLCGLTLKEKIVEVYDGCELSITPSIKK